jgi:hypothetical protein
MDASGCGSSGPWLFFTADEVAIVEAAVDRLIPPDNRGPGGKDAGCASPSAGRQALMSRRLMQKIRMFLYSIAAPDD